MRITLNRMASIFNRRCLEHTNCLMSPDHILLCLEGAFDFRINEPRPIDDGNDPQIKFKNLIRYWLFNVCFVVQRIRLTSC